MIVMYSVSLLGASSYSIGITPLITELQIYPGESQDYDITISNNTFETMKANLSVGDFEIVGDGKFVFLDAGTYERSAAGWANMDEAQLTVKPVSYLKFKVHVKVPRNVKAGGDYYAMIWVLFNPITPKNGNIKIAKILRFGSILHVTVKGKPAKSKIEIDKIKIMNFDQISTSTQRGLEIDAYVKNSGDTDFKVNGNLLITSPDRKVWGRMSMKMNTTNLVMPTVTRKMYALYDRTLPPGEYTAKVSLKVGNRYLGQKEYNFSIKNSKGTTRPLGVNVQLTPEEIISDARAGSSNMGKFGIYNKEFASIHASLSAVSLNMDENGKYVFGKSNLKTVRVYPPVFSLREDQKRIVPFSYRIPKKPQDAQMVFAIKIDTKVDKSTSKGSTFYIPVLTRIDGMTEYGFKITNVEKMITEESSQATQILRVWMKNIGNVFTHFNVKYDILDPDSHYLNLQTNSLFSEKGLLILPEKERYFDIPLSGYKYEKAGNYQLVFLLTYKKEKDKESQVRMETSFKITEKDIKMLKGKDDLK
jgi:hypothetical protein